MGRGLKSVLIASVAVGVFAPAASAASVSVRSTLAFANTEDPRGQVMVGEVKGRGLAGGISYRFRSATTGSFEFYDGRGSLRGRFTMQPSGGAGAGELGGAHTVTGGTGRYRRARGTLTFAARASDHVPAVVVYRGNVRGRLSTDPDSRSGNKGETRIPLSIRSAESKVDFVNPAPNDQSAALLTAAATASDRRIGRGVIVWKRLIKPGDEVPGTFTYFGADGRFSGSAVASRSSSAPLPARVTGGTGRFRGASGRLLYRTLNPGATSGYFPTSLSGDLRVGG